MLCEFVGFVGFGVWCYCSKEAGKSRKSYLQIHSSGRRGGPAFSLPINRVGAIPVC